LWFVPFDRSQNVWAVAPPSGEEHGRVVITGHVDTHRAALAMQSPGLWQTFQILSLLVGVANLVLLVVFAWGLLTVDPLPRTVAGRRHPAGHWPGVHLTARLRPVCERRQRQRQRRGRRAGPGRAPQGRAAGPHRRLPGEHRLRRSWLLWADGFHQAPRR